MRIWIQGFIWGDPMMREWRREEMMKASEQLPSVGKWCSVPPGDHGGWPRIPLRAFPSEVQLFSFLTGWGSLQGVSLCNSQSAQNTGWPCSRAGEGSHQCEWELSPEAAVTAKLAWAGMGSKHICYMDSREERTQSDINTVIGVLDSCKPSLMGAPALFQILIITLLANIY